LLASDLDAKVWFPLSGDPRHLAVADGRQIWGCFGSVGNADDATPSATTWHSPDEGRTWTKVGLTLPADAGLTPALLKRLPLEFINEATDPPLLLMFDGGLMSPAPGRDYDEWRLVGHVPTARRPASGAQHRGTIYVAAENRIFMSTDSAATWSSQPVHEFSRAEIRCQGDVCYALLSQGGSESNTVVTAAASTNQWKPLGSLEVPELAAALREETVERGPIARFGASAILARSDGVYVGGFVNAGEDAWGAVVFVKRTGELVALKGSLPGGVWALASGPDQSLWAVAYSLYKRVDDTWIPVWPVGPGSAGGAAQPRVAADGAAPRR
jgi:hypothetical protein